MSDRTLRTEILPTDNAGLCRAADLLRQGRLVAFPTETVYGLGADARSGAAVASLYAAKGRPRINPLIAHVPDLDSARQQGVFSAKALALAEAFWPGPLTLVLPVTSNCTVSDLARAGLPSVALRVPAHPNARALLQHAGIPVAAPSANRSGRISPTRASHVLSELQGLCDLVLDGGPTQVGLESTIVALTDDTPRLLRPGGLPRDTLEAVLGRPLLGRRDKTLAAPGMLTSHYAPAAAVQLNVDAPENDDGVLDFGGQLSGRGGQVYRDLSPRGDLVEAAANFFGLLREIDRENVPRIVVAPIPTHGLGEAINDRLRRAAADRS